MDRNGLVPGPLPHQISKQIRSNPIPELNLDLFFWNSRVRIIGRRLYTKSTEHVIDRFIFKKIMMSSFWRLFTWFIYKYLKYVRFTIAWRKREGMAWSRRKKGGSVEAAPNPVGRLLVSERRPENHGTRTNEDHVKLCGHVCRALAN